MLDGDEIYKLVLTLVLCSEFRFYINKYLKYEYSLKESSNLLSKLFDGRVSPMVASFAKQKGLGRDDITELKKLIADWEQEND